MNNLGLYIKEALQEGNEMYVPGIGVFTKERTPAYFDALQDKFMPPFYNTTLHEIEKADDSFVNFIAQKDNMSIEAAQSKLEKTLDVLRFDLERHREIILDGFGTLSKKDGKLVFSALTADNEFKAFEPVEEADILDPVLVGEEIVAEPVEGDALQDELEPELIPQLVSESSSNKRRLWPAIAVAICIVLAGVWFLKPSLQQPINDPVVEEKPEITQAVIIPDSLNDKDSTTITTEKIVAEVADEPQDSYEIIIAAFNTMKEAQEYVARTNAKGHQVYILKNNRPSNLNKISYSSFKTEKEATLALAKVRKELASEAWIYKRIKNNNQ